MRSLKMRVMIVVMAILLMLTSACSNREQSDMDVSESGTADGSLRDEESGGAEGESGSEDERNGEEKDHELPEEEENGPEDRIDLAVEEACQSILKGCTREFICGYLVDERFLSWVTAGYGEEVLFALAEAVEAGMTDPEQWYQQTGNSIHVLWDTYCKETGFQDYRLERVYWKECASQEEIVLDFIGDVNFAENWSTTRYLDQQVDGIFDCFSKSLMEELNGADIMMVNNEFTYSNRGTPLEGKKYTFRADPDRVYLLELIGADIVSLANNHAYDYGEDALLDTMDTLKEAGIPYVGAGRDLEEAMKPSYFIANGRKLAIVSATQIERSTPYTREATEDSPGVLKTLNPDKFVTVIEEAKENADFVIVYVHWGTEQNPYFESDQTALADAFIEAGADAIIGGHTHCLQGCEYREEVPIIYSLGNFWFNSNKLDTGIAQLVIHKDMSVDFRFLPCIQKKNKTYLVEDEADKERILDHMESISVGVNIDDMGYIIPEE